MSLFTPMPTEGIKLLNALYREPTIENLKKMMSIFVFDTRDLTDALFEARLNNMPSRRDHLDNFVKSLEANPKQFLTLARGSARSLRKLSSSGDAMTASCRWTPDYACSPGSPALSCIFTATAATGRSGNMPTVLISWCSISSHGLKGDDDYFS